MVWFLTSLALGGAVCEDGRTYVGPAEALLAEPPCAAISIDPGVYTRPARLTHPVRLRGAGVDATFWICEGPCLAAVADVEISGLTLASGGIAIEVRNAELTMFNAAVVPVGDTGGRIRLWDSDATLIDMEIEVAGRKPPAVEAVSRRGHDLNFEGVRFLGTPPRSGTMGSVYSVAYGVNCTRCSFDAVRPASRLPEPGIDPEDHVAVDLRLPTGRSRWPTKDCPEASESDVAQCADQCAGEAVGVCRMVYDGPSEACVPEAVCVAPDEVP